MKTESTNAGKADASKNTRSSRKTPAQQATNLSAPEYYVNRELSLLEFNRRVLAQAMDEKVPLLERMTYLCIASSNLDEFFEIRVSGVKQLLAYGSRQADRDGLLPAELLKRVRSVADELVKLQYQVLNEQLIPALKQENIHFLKRDAWSEEQQAWIKRYFNSEVFPVLTPMGLDPAHPFPRVLNKSLHFIVELEGKDAFGRNSGYAVVQAPRSLPRLINLPKEYTRGDINCIFLSSVIHAHVGDLFPGMSVAGCYQFRVTRNSDLFVDEEETNDLLRALEGELPARRFGDAVRLEISEECPPKVHNYLLSVFELGEIDLYRVNGPVNLNRLGAIYDMADHAHLKFPSFNSYLPVKLASGNLFDVINHGDVLLHHPFESFVPVVDFLRQAASDSSVIAIKQTLYRTGPESAIVDALVDAARGGKEVTVVIELRARFDEEANIALANRLHKAGAHVVYGVVGYKAHCKMVLVVRREGRHLRRYVHLGTGNYHSRTARLYTDYGLLSCDKDLGEDIHKVFQQLTGLGKAVKQKRILQAPFTLHKTLLQYIDREIENQKSKKPARIIAKMNSLTEPKIIEALYIASQAGVKIDLIVRGTCCLRPGIPGVSDNIQVRSIIGRFLEHTRVFYFANGGDEIVMCSSADWMERNFFRRVEICFPILNPRLQKRVIKESLTMYLSDNCQSWIMQSDGSYKQSKPGNSKPRIAQQILLETIAG